MKKYIVLIVVFIVSSTNAQWVQVILGGNLGRALYSDGINLYAGTNGGLYYTSDNGDNWTNIGPPNEGVFAITKVNNKIIVESENNRIFLTTNNGQSWYQPSPIMDKSVYAFAKNSNYIFAGTWGSGVYRSGDEGETWQYVGLNNTGIKDMLTVGNSLYVISMESGTKIYYTTDNGGPWKQSSLGYPASDPQGLFYSNGKLFASDDGLWASTDMGLSWHLQYGITFDSAGYPTDIMIFKKIAQYNQYLIAGVMFESIYISSDNGVNWEPFNDGMNSDWTFADVKINGSYIWALRDMFANAYKRPVADLLTGVNNENLPVNSFTLEQNYPNPFNPSTTIKFTLPEPSFVKLTIYNLLGEKIETLVNDYRIAGNYSLKFNAKSLPSGIYIYRISANGFSDSKKMLLLK